MKFVSAFALLSMAASVAAAPAGTCETQASCVSFTKSKLSSSCDGSDSGSGSCSYEICFVVDAGGSCPKAGDTFSHSCSAGADCDGADHGGELGESTTYEVCKIVGPGETATFILKDGGKGQCNAGGSITANGGSCAPTKFGNKIDTCTGNGAGVECEWSYTAPLCGPPGTGGDPHFRMWNGQRYSFHGEGDLLLVSSKDFKDGAGLDVHVRTTVKDFYSYISGAAVRIGENVLEFSESEEYPFMIDGEKVHKDDLPTSFAGYSLSAPSKTGTAVAYTLDYEDGTAEFLQYKNFLAVNVDGSEVDFANSVGMFGEHSTSKKLGRDGVTVFEDTDAFGFEWQVRPEEDGQLFQVARAPQWPEKVVMPATTSRRMGIHEDPVKVARAEEVCAHKSVEDFEFCVLDVLATGDEGMAGAW